MKPLPIVQPFVAAEVGLSIVLDGRIDNREELATLLESRGLACQSGSDAELILRVYQLCGIECPSQLLGDFAFAIWDARNQRFFCARDQIGVKPFVYYYSKNSLFAFGSEINSIITLDRIPRRLNESRLADYLVIELDRVDTTGTFYEEIQRLPNGYFLVVERDSIKIVNYWKPSLKEGPRYRSIEEYGDAFRDILMKATSDRIRDSGRIACTLSGGLDSTSVVAVVRELSGGAAHANLATFAQVDSGGQDALAMIRSVVDQGGIDSHLIWPEDVTAENFDLPAFIRDSNEPFEVDQCWFAWITYQAAQRYSFRIFLDGFDGDQMHPHPLCLSSLIRKGRWRAAIRDARYLAVDWKMPAWRLLALYGLFPLFPGTVRALVRVKHALRKPPAGPDIDWIDEDLALRTGVAERCQSRRQANLNAARDPFLLHSQSFTTGSLSFALEVNETLAGHLGMELLHPLADRRVAEFLISLPLERKVHFPASKSIMRAAMADFLPGPLLRQFRLPHPGPAFMNRLLDCHPEWLQSSLQKALHSLRGYVSLSAVGELDQRYRTNRQIEAGFALWNIAVLADWLDVKRIGG
jgi:asparagine synthase (glutamine-hydrolysing)